MAHFGGGRRHFPGRPVLVEAPLEEQEKVGQELVVVVFSADGRAERGRGFDETNDDDDNGQHARLFEQKRPAPGAID